MEVNKTGPDKDSCTCPICMYIMVEPVTMPCKHTLCMYCYKQTVAQSSLVCPICRQRISVWARRAAKINSLVDMSKWRAIQNAFPHKVQRRIELMAEGCENADEEDDDDSDDQDCETYLRKLKEVSKPGEIRQEYDAAMKKLQQQRELEAKKEEEASAALILALQEEEAREADRIRRDREEMERLGLAVAEQLQEASFEELRSRRAVASPQENTLTNKSKSNKPAAAKMVSRNKKASKPSRPVSSLDGKMNTLKNFFSPVPRTPSAPPRSMHFAALERREDRQLSPYPYPCISPKDKIFYGLSQLGRSPSQARSESCSSDEAPGLREEHSYSTASARVVDLTDASVVDGLCGERSDVPIYDLSKVKSEPEDIFGPGPSGLNMYSQQNPSAPASFIHSYSGSQEYRSPTVGSFQPIVAHQRTPPQKLPCGAEIEVPITRTTPKRLIFGQPVPESLHDPASDHHPSDNDNISSKMKSATGVGKTSAAAIRNKLATQVPKTSAVVSEPVAKTHPQKVFVSESPVVNGAEKSEPRCSAGSLSVCTGDKLNITDTGNESNKSALTNCSVTSDKSDQENSVVSFGEEPLLSSAAWSFVSSGDQPLRVSKCANTEQGKKTHCSGPLTSLDMIGGDVTSRLKETLQEAPANNSTGLKQSNGKNQPVSGKTKAVAKGKKSSGKPAAVTLDSFVQRKKRPFSCPSAEDIDNSDMTQEEKDHMLAVQLQEMYQELDKNNIKVDRFKGSVNEYSFRKKRKIVKF